MKLDKKKRVIKKIPKTFGHLQCFILHMNISRANDAAVVAVTAVAVVVAVASASEWWRKFLVSKWNQQMKHTKLKLSKIEAQIIRSSLVWMRTHVKSFIIIFYIGDFFV